MPGEVAAAAALVGMEPQAFFDKYLSVDYWEADDPVLLLSPAVVGGNRGGLFDGNPRGKCVFRIDDERCGIHGAKPFECRLAHHDRPRKALDATHKKIADAWRTPEARAEVDSLYDGDTTLPEYEGESLMGRLLGERWT